VNNQEFHLDVGTFKVILAWLGTLVGTLFSTALATFWQNLGPLVLLATLVFTIVNTYYLIKSKGGSAGRDKDSTI
jgi:hypothetical protein